MGIYFRKDGDLRGRLCWFQGGYSFAGFQKIHPKYTQTQQKQIREYRIYIAYMHQIFGLSVWWIHFFNDWVSTYHTIHVYVAAFGKLYGKYRQIHHTYPYMNCLGYKNWPPRSIPPRPLSLGHDFQQMAMLMLYKKTSTTIPSRCFPHQKTAKNTRWSSPVYCTEQPRCIKIRRR